MGKLKIVPMASEIVEQVRKTPKGAGVWLPGASGSGGGKSAVQTLPEVDPAEGRRIDFIYLRRVCGARCAAQPWAGVCACGGVRSVFGGRADSNGISGTAVDVGSVRSGTGEAGGEARAWERRGTGVARIVRTGRNGICACAEHFGGLLFVSGAAGVGKMKRKDNAEKCRGARRNARPRRSVRME